MTDNLHCVATIRACTHTPPLNLGYAIRIENGADIFSFSVKKQKRNKNTKMEMELYIMEIDFFLWKRKQNNVFY
jgi:hypothetical protein